MTATGGIRTYQGSVSIITGGASLFRTFPALEELIGKKLHARTLAELPEMRSVAAKPPSPTTSAARATAPA